MKTIKDNPNAMPFSGVNAHTGGDLAMRKLQLETMTTVIDGSDMVSQFEGKGYGDVNIKTPDVKVHSEADRKAISEQHTH